MSIDTRFLQKEIAWGYELEAMGRKIASEDWKRIGAEDMTFFRGVRDWHIETSIAIEKLHISVPGADFGMFLRTFDLLGTISYAIYDFFSSGIYGVDAERGARLRDITYAYESLIKELVLYNDTQRKITGEDGIWIYGKLMDSLTYTYSAFVNDYTSSFHRLINWLNRNYGSVVRINKRAYAFPNPLESAVKICIAWSDAVERYNKYGIYYDEDYHALMCLAKPRDAEARVGSSPGHATHMEFTDTGIKVMYYDTDDIVNETMAMLAKSYGITVVRIIPSEGVEMFVPYSKAMVFAQAVLPFATSMDIRLARPFEMWESWILEEASRYIDVRRLARENVKEFEVAMCRLLYTMVYGKI